jgi:hypothetical protein
MASGTAPACVWLSGSARLDAQVGYGSGPQDQNGPEPSTIMMMVNIDAFNMGLDWSAHTSCPTPCASSSVYSGVGICLCREPSLFLDTCNRINPHAVRWQQQRQQQQQQQVTVAHDRIARSARCRAMSLPIYAGAGMSHENMNQIGVCVPTFSVPYR